MALYGVPSTDIDVSKKRGKVIMPETESIKRLEKSIKAGQDEIKQLRDSLANYENQGTAELAALTEQVTQYEDMLDQFQEIVDKDHDGIQETAKELELDVKANEADRNVLSKIFSNLRASMIEPAEPEPADPAE